MKSKTSDQCYYYLTAFVVVFLQRISKIRHSCMHMRKGRDVEKVGHPQVGT